MKHFEGGSACRKNSAVSITEGSITKALLYFFFPIAAGTFFQQLYNTADAIIVGRFAGKTALAAVGGTPAVFSNFIVGFFLGLTSGCGVLVSQFYGSKNLQNLQKTVHTSITLSFMAGFVMTAIAIPLSPFILKLTGTPADTAPLSLVYMRIFFLGMIPLAVYNTGAAIIRATGDSARPFLILIAGCLANIALDLVFVVVLKKGVSGAACATVLCQLFCAMLTLFVLRKTNAEYRLNWKELSLSPDILSKMLRIGIPGGIQSSLYTTSNIIIQSFVNSFGTNTVASWAAYGKLDSIFWMLTGSLGIALTTFTGQNYGAGKFSRIRRGTYTALAIALALTLTMGLSFLLFAKPLLGFFTDDAYVIQEGTKIIRFMVPFWLTYISIEILTGTARGLSLTFVPMVITVFGVCALRLIWLFVEVRKNPSIIAVLKSYPITWTVTSLALWIYFAKKTTSVCKKS